MGAAKTILAIVENLMYSVKIRDAASALGVTTIFSNSNYEVLGKIETIHPSLLILDLTAVTTGWKDVVKKAKAHGLPVIAFGPHVQTDLRRMALEAGCDEVYANSKFTLETSLILQKYLGKPS